MASCCVRFLILLSLLAIETTSQGNGPYFIGPRDSSACILLHDHNPSKTFVRSDTGYISAVNDSWSKTCVLSPQCVFAPSNAKDVSNALTILTRSQTKFAVRSGGHMPVPGASSITDGVLISLSNLSTMIMNADNTVTIGAGLRWRDVYRYVSSYGRGICGGRFGDVGVGGLLLGGGISHFGSQYGWSANLVTEYELVLSNGRIICVSTNHYRDLFWALKGGLNNFGIVTKFTIKTFPVTEVYGGSMIFAPTSFNDFVTAVANYASPSGGMSDSLSAIEPVMAFTPSVGAAQGGTLLFRQGSDTDPASLANFTAIPHVSSDVSLRPTFAAFTDETNAPQYNDYSQRQLYFTVSLKAVSESVYLVNNTFAPLALSSLKNVSGFTTTINHQPISQNWIAAAEQSGSDALDLDPADGAFISVGISSFWRDAADDEAVFDFHTRATAAIKTAADAKGLSYNFLYINDAHPVQEPFQYYGKGRSLPRMRHLAKKYDPLGVFQTLNQGIWRLF